MSDNPTQPNRQRASLWCRSQGVSLQTFHRWRLRPDGPPCLKIFGQWFIEADAMEQWIAERSRRPSDASPRAMSARRRFEIQAAMQEARKLMSA
jgi:hypothetical protein